MWLDALDQAQLHRELAIAILDSALAVPGSKRAFAAAVGITPQYLSYLCDPLGSHQPSPALAERLAAALPGDADLRHRLLGHLLGARAARAVGRRAVRGAGTALTAALVTLRAARDAATFAPDPVGAARQYRVVRDAVAALLPAVSPARSPLDFCELCLLAHDVECVLNAADRALWYARQAQVVPADVQARDGLPDDPRYAHYTVNIPMAVAVAYNNLRLPGPALEAYAAAVAAAGVGGPAGLAFWLPHLHRGWINTLAKQPRFTLGDVTGLADPGAAGRRAAQWAG